VQAITAETQYLVQSLQMAAAAAADKMVQMVAAVAAVASSQHQAAQQVVHLHLDKGLPA
jgi:hypothetical protein